MNRLVFFTRRRREFERGQAALAFVAIVPALMLLVGVVADTGHFLMVQRRAQVAVDSAALAAATALNENTFMNSNNVELEVGLAQSAASHYAHTNYPALAVACAVNGTRVTCTGSADVPTYFMRLVGITSVHVSAHADSEFKYGIEQEGQ
jgi:Flp pilus assembly protein TadG